MKPAIARDGETALKQPVTKRVARDGVRLRLDVDRQKGLETPKIGVIYNPKSAANLDQWRIRKFLLSSGHHAQCARAHPALQS